MRFQNIKRGKAEIKWIARLAYRVPSQRVFNIFNQAFVKLRGNRSGTAAQTDSSCRKFSCRLWKARSVTHSCWNISSFCNKTSQGELFLDGFNGYLSDVSALTWCCPGNRSLVSRWPCDGTSCRARCPGRSHSAERQTEIHRGGDKRKTKKRGRENGRENEVGMFPVSVPFILNQSTL